MTHGSAKRKVQCTALLAAGLSSALELGVIALVFLSCFKSGECIEKTFCCNNTPVCSWIVQQRVLGRKRTCRGALVKQGWVCSQADFRHK